LHFLPDSLEVEHYWWVADNHLKGHFAKLFQELHDALIDVWRFIGDAEHTLYLLHNLFVILNGQTLSVNGLPIRLIGFLQYIYYWTIGKRGLQETDLFQSLLNWQEMFLYGLDYGWQCILEKVDYTFKVKLWTQNVEKAVLAIALIELSHYVLQLVLHWKGT
jgi:hypothetical protein